MTYARYNTYPCQPIPLVALLQLTIAATLGPGGLGQPLAPPWVAGELLAQEGQIAGVTEIEPRVRHGRREERMFWALHDPGLNRYAGSGGAQGIPWPRLEQVCRLERRRTPWRKGQPAGETRVEVSYYITSAPPGRLEARGLLRRGGGIGGSRTWFEVMKRPWLLTPCRFRLRPKCAIIPRVVCRGDFDTVILRESFDKVSTSSTRRLRINSATEKSLLPTRDFLLRSK